VTFLKAASSLSVLSKLSSKLCFIENNEEMSG
jgi:hypothetical protein